MSDSSLATVRRPGHDGSRRESVFAWSGHPIRFGFGASDEVGPELARLGAASALVVTDKNVRGMAVADHVAESLRRAGLAVRWWDEVEPEPRVSSILGAVEALRDVTVDAYVAVGGGSSIDTCKVLNLLRTHGGEISDWLVPPHGAGVPVPGSLAPMMAVPTTAGTGSETTSTAIIAMGDHGVKAAVADHAMRPMLAFIDPLNVATCPPAVTAATGYDVIVQAVESLTSCRFDDRPAVGGGRRPAYAGGTPITDMWCERALILVARSFEKCVADGSDLMARRDMCLAALFSRFGNAGVHVPHAAAYAVAALASGYRAPGYDAQRDFVPHGLAVASVAPASLRVTYDGCPDRHLLAAELLGVPEEDRRDRGRDCLPDFLRSLIRRTGEPLALSSMGLTETAVGEAVSIASQQERLMTAAPLAVGTDDLKQVFLASLGHRRLEGDRT